MIDLERNRVSYAAAIGLGFLGLVAGVAAGYLSRSAARDESPRRTERRPLASISRNSSPERLRSGGDLQKDTSLKSSGDLGPSDRNALPGLATALPELSKLLHAEREHEDQAWPAEQFATRARRAFSRGSPGRWKNLILLVREDRESSLAFLRRPENERVLDPLLYLYETEFTQSPGDVSYLSAVLEGFLRDGSPRQKLAALACLDRNPPKASSALEAWPGRATDLCLDLLSGSDPEIARLALRRLSGHGGDAVVEHFDRIEEAGERLGDAEFRIDCLEELVDQKGPRAQALFLDQLAKELRRPGVEGKEEAVSALNRRALEGVAEGERTDYLPFLSEMIAAGPEASLYRSLLESSIEILPRDRCLAFLQSARQKSPTGELLEGTDRVLELLTRGETRPSVLREALGQLPER